MRLEISNERIAQTTGSSRVVYFLDLVSITKDGRKARSNITSGSLTHCERIRDQVKTGQDEDGNTYWSL